MPHALSHGRDRSGIAGASVYSATAYPESRTVTRMSVRQSLLAILDQGPCYGSQLRSEFSRRTGGTWPLNVGQIYNTLERLHRDGLVVPGETDAHGHVYWQITDAGRRAAHEWFARPRPSVEGTRDELTLKLTLAATLPGVDVDVMVRTQRAASSAVLAALRDAPGDDDDLAGELVLESRRLALEAELRWLDLVAERVAQHPQHALAIELSTEKPKRGRPARAGASAV